MQSNDKESTSQWTLLRHSVNNELPKEILQETDKLISSHNNKKKVDENFFQHKLTEYKTYYNQSLISSKEVTYTTFAEIPNLKESLKSNLDMLNFKTLTAIQIATIGIGMNESNDIVGCSDTGSGKTLAFLLPVISNMLDTCKNISIQNSKTSPFVLILAPTRELAEQINTEARKIIHRIGIHSVAVYGGVKLFIQDKLLHYGAEILVSTPGRLIDMLKHDKAKLNNVKYFIIDEADEMLNKGFHPQIKEILDNFDLPKKEKRQNLLFSATFDDEVKILARDLLKGDHYFVTNQNQESKLKLKKNVNQNVIAVNDDHQKIDYICDLLKEWKNSIGIIFVNKKVRVNIFEEEFNRKNFMTAAIHGDKVQCIRNETISKFREGKFRLIVATNILARGLDFVNVDFVFNFDLPSNIEEYIHRIGRTGRLGQVGHAVTFILREDKNKKVMSDLIPYLFNCENDVPKWLSNLSGSNYNFRKINNKESIEYKEYKDSKDNGNNWNGGNSRSSNGFNSNSNSNNRQNEDTFLQRKRERSPSKFEW
jgi:ATP-dependent RNA helicase DDX3X